MSQKWIGLRLDAIDTLFFRDGRPFDAANRVQGGMPTPQTLAGAIRTTLLGASGFFKNNPNANLKAILEKGDKAITGARFRGPFLALVSPDGKVIPLFDPPAILGLDKKGEFIRKHPKEIEIPGWNDPDGLLPLVWEKGKGQEPDAKGELPLLTFDGLKAVLNGGLPKPNQTVAPKLLKQHDNRTGIVIDEETLATKEGQIYGIQFLTLNPEIKIKKEEPTSVFWKGYSVCLYAEMLPHEEGSFDCKEALTNTPIPFGGEGRNVVASVVEPQQWPLVDPSKTHSMCYLATPTFLPFSKKSHRPLPVGVKAAISGAGIAVSGWDVVHNGPHATRFAVPAGACYFFEQAVTPELFLNQELKDTLNLAQCGWGFALQGIWENKS